MFLFMASVASADNLTFNYKSPAFTGNGYSAHVLTIEQLESNRRTENDKKAKASTDESERDLRATNTWKFQNNLESRIYSQLSKQISDSLFGEGAAADDAQGTVTTPFGDTVAWSRIDDVISVTVSDSNGSVLSTFSVPVGDFSF
tara:strand:- start:613 stop:1047 length:435 start_codon:yes stop_codon:yes gene_type:complete